MKLLTPLFFTHQIQATWWRSDNVVGHINEVTLRQAGLTLIWVTVRGYLTKPTQPGHPSLVAEVRRPTSSGYGYQYVENLSNLFSSKSIPFSIHTKWQVLYNGRPCDQFCWRNC